MSKGRQVKEKPRVLWVSDAVAHTGFATVCDNVVRRLLGDFDVYVLGINYFGDPHDKPYKVYPAALGGDYFGVNRLEQLILSIKPEVVFVNNDPWVATEYIPILNKFPSIRKILYTPIDGLNVPSKFVEKINEGYNIVIAYNNFGREQLEMSGLTLPCFVIQHGVDTKSFYPIDKKKARKTLGIPEDWFIVGFVGRNQPRKRIDLLIKSFSIFSTSLPKTVKLYYHGALRDMGWDIEQLAQFYGIDDRLMVSSRDIQPNVGVNIDVLNLIYNSMDIHASTTQGEGFGLTHAESAACKIPQVVPFWSGLADWLEGAAVFVECRSDYVNTGGINTIGGVVDTRDFARALMFLYEDENKRKHFGELAYYRVHLPEFNWDIIAKKFASVMKYGEIKC
jgi:glycosyltransferase involved in cell wall biosynthesis